MNAAIARAVGSTSSSAPIPDRSWLKLGANFITVQSYRMIRISGADKGYDPQA